MHGADEVQANVSVRAHPHVLIGLGHSQHAHLQQIAVADHRHVGFFVGCRGFTVLAGWSWTQADGAGGAASDSGTDAGDAWPTTSVDGYPRQ